jgi:hypothetical protein
MISSSEVATPEGSERDPAPLPVEFIFVVCN